MTNHRNNFYIKKEQQKKVDKKSADHITIL